MLEKKDLVYELEGKPPLIMAIPLGMQHVLAMFVGNLTPLLVVGGAFVRSGGNIDLTYLTQCAMVLAGVCTLVQLYRLGPIGSGLPVVMGTSSAFIGVNSAIVATHGWAGLMGASLVGGLFEMLLGSFAKRIKKYFPPLVTGITVLSIGLTLIPIGVSNFAGGGSPTINPEYGSLTNLALGFIVLVASVILKIFGKGLFSLASILFSMLIGYVFAIFFGVVDLSVVTNAGWFAVPVPFKYGMTFKFDAIFPILFMFIVTAIETIGDTTGVTQGGLNREPTDEEMRGTILADGFSSTLASLFMVSPLTSFSQNVGLVRMTKVVNRFAISTGAIFLIIAGFIPKIGAIFASVPPSVLGGAVLIMFASIAVTGLSLLSQVKLNSKNSLIVAISLGIGIGFGQGSGVSAIANLPYAVKLIFGGNGIAAATLIALVLNIIIPERE